MLTYEEQETERQERLNEIGTEPACPMCDQPRVKRSDYVRCNPCGLNWLKDEPLDRNPKVYRWEQLLIALRQVTIPSADARSA